MIEGIISGLIVTIIVAFVTFFYRNGYLYLFVDNLISAVGLLKITDKKIGLKEFRGLQKKLVARILHDQSKIGNHLGQYGKSCKYIYSEKWQTKSSKENLKLKPRMYLTYWPVIILRKHGLANRSTNLALSGVKRLFKDWRIPLYSGSPGLSPTKIEQNWNYRHSMAGAHLVGLCMPYNSITYNVVDQMIDERNVWQDTETGGWWQTSEKKESPDLWASVYALKLLHMVYEDRKYDVFYHNKDLRCCIEKTIKYFKYEWINNKWSVPDKLLTEENLISMFIDLSLLLSVYMPELRKECIIYMKEWLTPRCDLSNRFLKKLKNRPLPINQGQAYSQMAYAFYLSKDELVDWRLIYKKAIMFPLNELYSSEMAFLLDCSYEYEKYM